MQFLLTGYTHNAFFVETSSEIHWMFFFRWKNKRTNSSIKQKAKNKQFCASWNSLLPDENVFCIYSIYVLCTWMNVISWQSLSIQWKWRTDKFYTKLSKPLVVLILHISSIAQCGGLLLYFVHCILSNITYHHIYRLLNYST